MMLCGGVGGSQSACTPLLLSARSDGGSVVSEAPVSSRLLGRTEEPVPPRTTATAAWGADKGSGNDDEEEEEDSEEDEGEEGGSGSSDKDERATGQPVTALPATTATRTRPFLTLSHPPGPACGLRFDCPQMPRPPPPPRRPPCPRRRPPPAALTTTGAAAAAEGGQPGRRRRTCRTRTC